MFDILALSDEVMYAVGGADAGHALLDNGPESIGREESPESVGGYLRICRPRLLPRRLSDGTMISRG